MAFEIGTANDSIDLWDKLLSFLTTNADLVAANEQWEIVRTYSSSGMPRVVLKGVGATGLDNIYVGLARTDTPDTDTKNIRIVGMTGVLDSAPAFNEHINVSPEVRIWLDGSPMKYWFVASGRRFVVVVNMSTVYQTAYAGFFLPYANPLIYPYPMFVGGSSNAWTGTNAVLNWRSQSGYHAHFCFSPYNGEGGSSAPFRTNGYMLDPTGAWRSVGIGSNSLDINIACRHFNTLEWDGSNYWDTSNTTDYSSGGRYGSASIRERITQNYGGGFTLDPFTLIQTAPNTQNLGIFDGVYSCPGVANAAENIIQIDGVDHLVVQNVWRTNVFDYWALRLE